jgi:hypothetical protein
LINLRAHALQLELYKIGHTNFVKFQLSSSKIEQAFEKMTKNVFVFILPTTTLYLLFAFFLLCINKNKPAAQAADADPAPQIGKSTSSVKWP